MCQHCSRVAGDGAVTKAEEKETNRKMSPQQLSGSQPHLNVRLDQPGCELEFCTQMQNLIILGVT